MILRTGAWLSLFARKRFSGFEIAVDDAERVRLGEGVAGLEHVVHGELRRERPFPHGLPERGPLEVLHDHVGPRAVELPHVVHLDDVLGLDLRGQPRLAEEARHNLLVRQTGLQVLDRDLLIERDVASDDHGPQPPRTERPLHEVLAGDEAAHAEGGGTAFAVGLGRGGHRQTPRGKRRRKQAPRPWRLANDSSAPSCCASS